MSDEKYKHACGVLLVAMTEYGCTPEEGYADAPFCIESDIRRAVKQAEQRGAQRVLKVVKELIHEMAHEDAYASPDEAVTLEAFEMRLKMRLRQTQEPKS